MAKCIHCGHDWSRDVDIMAERVTRLRAREAVLVEALTETGRTCDFLRSIILSGEGWSEAARASYDETHGLRQRALATISDDSE